MKTMEQNIAYNLKKIRKSRNMSLDMLAELTGVSKSMLGQIERGESNPTIGTIGKIVEGLKVSFEELAYAAQEDVTVANADQFHMIRQEQNQYRVNVIFPYDKQCKLEVYEMVIEEGASLREMPHGENILEYVLVKEGKLILSVSDKEYMAGENDAMRFVANAEHVYYNAGTGRLHLQVIMSLQLK